MKLVSVTVPFIVVCLSAAAGAADEARLLRNPSISAEHVAFVYANDIWVASRDGGEPRRLTTFPGAESEPHFSPDGGLVAFSGEYDGNVDVYVVPVAGGEPRRLTWHPLPDQVRGWTVDGQQVLFASGRINAPRPQPRLWTISLRGGMPTPLPVPQVENGHFSPDGDRMAYQQVTPWETEFRNYRGGQAQPIRLIDLRSLEVVKLPWTGSNDLAPVWLDDTLFFLSDRDFAMNVWSFHVPSGTLEQRTFFSEFDCKDLEGGHGRLVFSNGGWLYVMDAAGGEPRRLSITLAGDFPWARPHWADAREQIREFSLSPTGQRALFEARGEVFTVPADKGDIRNLTRSSGAADRVPAWSPDGRWIAWFSDESGEYELVVADQFGRQRRTIPVPDPTFFYTLRWSPDSERLAFGDADRNLWVLQVDSGEASRIDNEGFAHPTRIIYPEWSPDSRWIAYAKRLENQYGAVFVYSVQDGTTHQITDGLANANTPAWDASGRYLYFLASTDYGLNVGWLDLSSYNVPVHSSVYLAVLDAGEPSPLAPESDEEEADADEAEDATEDEDIEVHIDFDGLSERIVALGLPARAYSNLAAGAAGTLFLTENVDNQPGLTLHRYSLEERESKVVETGVLGFTVSADGSKLMYRQPDNRFVVVDAAKTAAPAMPPALPGMGEGGKALDLADLRLKVDPPAEWRQMFREAWRFQRDYFYVENVHGLDLDWAWTTYAPWLDHVRHRADLGWLLDVLGGETAVGHSFVGGGDIPEVETVPVGLLGADYTVADGRYRIARIYTSESWNPNLEAPLSGPGIDVEAGDYLLAVNGVELEAGMNLYSLFDRTAGRQTVITVNADPEMDGARELTVVPVDDEEGLRRRAWIEDNRRRVAELSRGRLAYVWVPDTGAGGHRSFTRDYFAQTDKHGVILDERFNHGGSIADYMVDLMSRELLGYFNNPVGNRQPFTAPNGAIFGPKVLIINEMSGSGGDMLPYMFRAKEIGPLVGTRTWGGLVGIWDVPELVDGGYITAPRGGFYDVDGRWAVENEGVAPDVEVEQLPSLVAAGRDPQLERAVQMALELMDTEGVDLLPQPPDPVRVRRPEPRE